MGSTAAPVAAAALAAPVLVGSPDTEASAVWIQLRSGMIRASSRMKRSQSKRVCATELDAREALLLDLGEVGEGGLLRGGLLEAVASASALAASLLREVAWLDTTT